jgi:hypothetical protein
LIDDDLNVLLQAKRSCFYHGRSLEYVRRLLELATQPGVTP